MGEEFEYTTETVRGGLFVGRITLEMVERAAEALCKEDGGDGDGCECMDLHRRDANAALHAALQSPSSQAPKETE